MEKRFRKLGKSLSPSGFGLGSKAPPSKRTRSQTKNSSAASGLTTSQQTVVPQSGSEPSGNFHGIPGTGGSPTAKLDNINIGQLEDNLKSTNNTRASFSQEKANSDSFLFTSGNFGKQSEPRVHPVKAIDKGDSEGESVKKELQESQNILRSLELQHHKRQLQETREKIENMKLKMGGHPRDESNHIKWEPRANVNWPPRNEVFPGNNAPMASTNELSHYADVASQNSTSKQVRFDSNVGNNVNSAQTPNPFYPPRDQTESRRHAVSSNKIAELKNSLKIDVSNDPRDELRFFEKTCRTNGIFSEPDMYTILITVWPNQDIRNYWAVSEEEEECYQGLKRFLSDKNGKLNRIFKPQPNWSTVSGMALTIEVKKYMSELLKGDNLKKYLYLQLAPESLKCKIKEIIGCDIENFEARCMNICDASYQEQKNGFPPFQH